jgi:hypothetical protein
MNAYLYCDNDPVNKIDSDGHHPILGFHHEFVVGWLVFNPASPLFGATPNVTIRGGGRSGLPGSRGYADLIHVTGVYEVKPRGARNERQGRKQLDRYTGGDGVITYTYTLANPVIQKELDSCRTKQAIYALALYKLAEIVFKIFDKIPARGWGGGCGVPGGAGWGLEYSLK